MSLSKSDRDKIPTKDFGVPDKQKYPLDTEAHINSAAHLINHGDITSGEKKTLARKILNRANAKGMDTSGWNTVKKIAEQVPPMSDGTSIGNSPPRLMAPYYDEQDELLQRANSLDPNSKETMFDKAKRIVTMIHNKTEQDSKPPTGNQNCQLCTWCAEAQFRGMNVLPRPVYSPRDPELAVKGENIVLRPVRRSFTSQRDVVETVRGAVDSRWYVHVNWAESAGGHEFLVVNLNDYAYIMDAQAGLLHEIDETDTSHNYFRDINFRNSYMVRLDDREFNTKLFNEMNDMSKLVPWKNSLDIPYMRDNGMLAPGDDDDPRFRRVFVPSEEGTKYMKQDPELSQYWEELNKATTGEFLVDRDTGEAIGHVFVHTNAKDKGFIFNLEVNPKYRRQGYGWILTDDAVRRLGGEDLTVDADNTPAVNLYLQYGFTIYKKGQWHYDPPKDELWMKYDRSKLKQESTNIFESGHFAKYKDDVLGFNDEGMAVMKKCKCGGKVSVYLRGEPVYLCEKCGKYYGTLPCNIQEGVVRNIRDMTLIPVKDFKYDKVYYGDPTDGGSVRKLDDKPLFVTPHMGLASIFVGRRHIFRKLSEMGYHEVNLGYDEWSSTPDQPLTDVHVYVRNAPNLKPFTVEFDGYLHTIDCSQLKDNIYRYPWMSDIEHEILIAKVPEVKIDNVQKLHIRYHVRGIEELEPSSHVQEGAFQDLKNGVNPFSDDLVFHVTPDKHVDGQIWKPRVPDYLDPYNPEDTGFEDNTTPRICFSTSIEGCLNGITVNLQRQSPDTFDKMYVYVPEKPWKEYKHKTNKQLVKDKLVYDANVTREVWIMEPVRMKLYGVIRVDQIADAKRKSVVPTSKGQKDTRNYFTYKWHWVVKPKVLQKATKFDYSPERVIDDLCIDVKKFKYGLIKDGKLQTGNVSDADYDKYWVFHSGQEVDEAGGGNCYDMVEYEAGYLEAFGVPYKKYFMNFTDTKNTKTVNTHTICVVPHNGKFIYIEQAFKRVVDEWGYERKKVFDKLTDIFEYVAEVAAEYENQDLNYGVWDYTNAEIDYGTPIKNFMEWIMTKCNMIYDGEATKSKPVKEGFNLNDYDDDTILECDMFIELGDSMFYVSEYHNALFDDPDAHDEAINEFGILLDSYDDEIIQEAAYGPYDEYLKRREYDPKTNTISVNGKRYNAGRIGSNKERNRMNKFLRENGYDPKTETILTDINDGKGGKKRVKFRIDPTEGAQAGLMKNKKTGEQSQYISMQPSEMRNKPYSSNSTLKHEEGHIAQFDSKFDPLITREYKPNGAVTSDVMKAQDYLDNMSDSDKNKIKSNHDLDPEEYHADAYSELHNRYSKRGDSQKRSLMNYVYDFEKKLNTMDAQIKSQAKRKANVATKHDRHLIDILKKNPNNPGPNASYKDWAEFLKRVMPEHKETFDIYLEYEKETDEIKNKMKEIKQRINSVDIDSDEYDEIYDNELKPLLEKMREIRDDDANKSVHVRTAMEYIRDFRDLTLLNDEEINRMINDKKKDISDKYITKKKADIANRNYRDPEEYAFAHQKRGEYAQQQWMERDKQQKAVAAKQRQLAKEQLKQQIASGKLTGDQAAKAERKIQRIEAFEKQQAQNQPIPKTKPVKPQTTNTTPPPTSTSSSDKPLSVQNQSLTTPPKQEQKPTIKKEGYKLNRFNRFDTDNDYMYPDIYQETAKGRINRTINRNLKAVGYNKLTKTIITEDPETHEQYPISISNISADEALNLINSIAEKTGDMVKLDPNDNRIKARSKLILSKLLAKSLPPQRIQNEVTARTNISIAGDTLNLPRDILTRLNKNEFKALVDHEIQHANQFRMNQRGSGEEVDRSGYNIPGGAIARKLGGMIQKSLGANGGISVGQNATTQWIKDYVNSPAGRDLEKSHDKYLFELEADAVAVRKNGAKVYTQALRHFSAMQMEITKSVMLREMKTELAKSHDMNIKALGNLKSYMHMHNGEIDDATLKKLLSFTESKVDKVSSAIIQIGKQIKEIRSYAKSNGIPMRFGTIKEIMQTLGSIEKITSSFNNPYTTLNASRKEKLLKMTPENRIKYIDKVYQRCVDARKDSVNMDKLTEKLDKLAEKQRKNYDARCRFCMEIEKAAPWKKAAVAEYVAVMSEIYGLVFTEEYSMVDLATDILTDESSSAMFDGYDDAFENSFVEYATDDSYYDIYTEGFFYEAEENLSDEMEDITVGDLNLEDEEKTTEEKPDTDDNDDFDENGKAYDDENGYDFDPQLLGDTNDIDVEDDELELPGYMKERMSEEDREEYEQPDENISADNADLGSFGKDTSDVQNDYDPKEIETLMKLMASEADAMNEYMDGAKETNVDVLRRLYADIANEERFHMEQLLFAKSELTGEKYVPKDPEVKDEYEELLKMGMDEETAMQTAVDKCHIRGSMANDDQEATVELQADVEMMEMTINLFNTQFDNIMLMMESNSFKKEEFDHAVDVFMESCIIQEEVENVHVDDNKNARLNSGKHNGPIDILKKSLGTILHLLMSLVRKFVDFLRRTKNRSRAIANYVKRYGVSGLFASSKDTLKLYFIDIDAPACINDSTETLLTLAMDTFNACTRVIGGQPMQINARRDPRMNINGNIERGISLLNGVQLIKTKMILPDDDAKQQNIAACLFGFTANSRAADGTSNNTLNRLKVYADYWTLMMNNVIKSLDRMNIMKTQQGSVYNSNKQKYDLVIKGFESIIKTCKAVVTALQNDISVLMKLNNEAMNASIKKTQEYDEKVIQNNDNIKAQNQQYNQVMGKTNQSPQ